MFTPVTRLLLYVIDTFPYIGLFEKRLQAQSFSPSNSKNIPLDSLYKPALVQAPAQVDTVITEFSPDGFTFVAYVNAGLIVVW